MKDLYDFLKIEENAPTAVKYVHDMRENEKIKRVRV